MDAAEKKSSGIIVLAAGAASRMQQPKQLLEFEGATLLRRAAETAVRSVFEPVVVVLGANYDKTRKEVEDLPVNICRNENFKIGLSSSIIAGLRELLKISPGISGVIITLADQPFITSQILDSFASRQAASQKEILAAEYDETPGVPALFDRTIFEDLLQLTGDRGARAIFNQCAGLLETIKLPEAAFDIDTPQDYQRLKSLPLPNTLQ